MRVLSDYEENLRSEYIDLNLSYGVATRKLFSTDAPNLNTDEVNKLSTKICDLTNKIWSLDDAGEQIFTSLLDHKDEYVQLGAASSVLSLNESHAMQVLQDLIQNTNDFTINTTASTVAELWSVDGELQHLKDRHYEMHR